ncbi:MAG: acyl-CoA thioesterase [Acholeplasmatales bacterium]|nr:acyl-CoA thioesterase [Acholeplasmatales bacterium]
MMTYERKAFYHETDQMGVIHHSNYLRWLEEARIFFLDNLGLSYKKMEEIGIISPVVSIKLDYIKPVHFDDYVLIDMKVIKYTGVKMIFEYVIRDKNTNDVMVRAESSHCFTNGKSVISFKREYPEYHKIIDDYVNSSLND